MGLARLFRISGAIAAALALLATAGSAAASGHRSLVGGTYRVGWEPDLTDHFDPTGELAATGIYTNLLLRTLVGYEHVAGLAGHRIVPDLAVSVPTPTNRGRTYTFTLKRGVRFGPPVDREITSNDIRYAIERVARPRNGALYPVYYRVIRGFDAYRAGHSRSVSGIATPNARTIRFDLVRPAGDFLDLLALPAAAPIPPEVGRCFEGRPGAYGHDVISSGPYMLLGSDTLKIGSCRTITPLSPPSAKALTLVRNPRYDPRTDTRTARENNPDRFVFVGGFAVGQTRNVVAIMARLANGELDDAILVTSPKVIGRYARAAAKRGLLHIDSPNWLHYIAMNLTLPPFDDVHVRRAMSWIVDKAALREAFGGPMAGPIAQHALPDDLLGGELDGFAPYKTPGDHGDLARAKAEMAKSKYATKDGVCTASACKNVPLSPFTFFEGYPAGQRMAPVLKADGARIGIEFRGSSRFYSKFFIPSAGVAFTPSASFIQIYPDPSNFVDPLLSGADIRANGNVNASLVGITPGQASRLGLRGDFRNVPSIDSDLARCSMLSGRRRSSCYAALDRKVSTEIVPWIPFLWRSRINILGPQVRKWEFDASTGMTSFAHVAVRR